MGLDMYLSASKYIGAWNHSSEQDKQMNRAVLKAAGLSGVQCNGSPSLRVVVNVAYWRKANMIHKWFVDHVADGDDQCDEHDVDIEQLRELVTTCKQVLADHPKAEELLPPQEGFFFGSTDIDEDYFDDLRLTVEQLEPLLTNPVLVNCNFTYRASW